MHRREFLAAAAAASTQLSAAFAEAVPARNEKQDKLLEQLLRLMVPSRQDVDLFLEGTVGPEKLSRNQGYEFDANLGWALCDSIRPRGLLDTNTFQHYEPDGARKVLNGIGRPCRVHTYGDSMVHCDQASDGETWQEYLAAHLQEPIRNYGVGGYSVYQAYRRMLEVETKQPAKYVILGIHEDDHFRNIEPWVGVRAIRRGKNFAYHRANHFTRPFLRVNVAKDTCEQVENLCRTPKDVYKLCDWDFVWKTFKDDAYLRLLVSITADDALQKELLEPAECLFGIPPERLRDTADARKLRQIFNAAAYYATRTVLGWVEKLVAKNKQELMVILWYAHGSVENALAGKPHYNEPTESEFLAWMKKKPYPVIDVRDLFRADFQKSKQMPQEFVKPYYIGHHTPAGNFFIAWAIKDHLVKWLDPKPLPYRK